MHVLQHAQSVVGRGDSEVFGEFFIPVAGKVFDLQTAVDKFLFYFVTKHDVQRIGEFVRLRTHKTAFGAVDEVYKLFFRNLAELHGEVLLQVFVMHFPESVAAPYHVFVETGLTFVHAQTCSAAAQRAVERPVALLFVKGVSRFVNYRIDCRHNVVFVIVVGDSHVVGAETACEGVFAFLHYSTGFVETHDVTQVLAKTFLPLFVAQLRCPIGYRRRICGHFFYQRYKFFFQQSKKFVVLLCGVMRFEHVQKHVVTFGFAVGKPNGRFATVVHYFFQVGAEKFKVVFRLCLDVHGVRLRNKQVVGRVLFLGNTACLTNVFFHYFHFVAKHVVQQLPVAVQRFHRLHEFFVGNKFVTVFRKYCAVLGVGGNTLRCGIRLHIPRDDEIGKMLRQNFSALLFVKLQSLFKLHITPLLMFLIVFFFRLCA